MWTSTNNLIVKHVPGQIVSSGGGWEIVVNKWRRIVHDFLISMRVFIPFLIISHVSHLISAENLITAAELTPSAELGVSFQDPIQGLL
jgi:hypothetical protein